MTTTAVLGYDPEDAIAIIGLAGRFPGAKTLAQFWENLRGGVEAIQPLQDEQLVSSGVDADLVHQPNYVKVAALLEDIESFDAAFFGYTPREAELIDPQQRLFLELTWEALEDAGYHPGPEPARVGVYAGVGLNGYLLFNLLRQPRLMENPDQLQMIVASDKDYLATRVSYKLNLSGPSLNVQTACSSSLVATHLACESLLQGECDMALAGGVSIIVPHTSGYLYQEGGIVSPDGHCRAFDAGAQGTVFGSGGGAVVLKRLSDALADGDHVYAVIRGSAINNDGARKVGYTAPSVDGQTRVIAAAQAIAGVHPESIGYIEAHGTGTALGDPIEIAALTQAFRAHTRKRQFCAIGSIKTNIGHLDAAAGIAGLIKTVLMLTHGEIPPTLHFEQPNPTTAMQHTPFYVAAKPMPWPSGPTPRRAGVSAFGVGGTNAHVILEEAPPLPTPGVERPQHLLLLSAKTSTALEGASQNLASHLADHPDLCLTDVAYTLQIGRQHFGHRQALICRDRDEAVAALRGELPQYTLRWTTERETSEALPVVFLFPGQGAQHVNMGREIYDQEPFFREIVDRCATLLIPHLGLDLRTVLYPDTTPAEGRGVTAPEADTPPISLDQTWLAQPALFVIEYALARLWMHWGVQPEAMIGHSIGEYVAAALAGVFELEDALRLVAARGRLMQALPAGAMLSVPLGGEAVQPYLGDGVELAASNAPELCVVAGPAAAIEQLEQRLAHDGITARRLHTSHAFHSAMMDPILEPYRALLQSVALQPPALMYLSNVTGTWMRRGDALNPSYWVQHLRSPVRFDAALQEVLQQPGQILLELGPGQTLGSLAHQMVEPAAGHVVLATLGARRSADGSGGLEALLTCLGQLWLRGQAIDWTTHYGDQRPRRVPLPTYPFDRQRYWIEPQPTALVAQPTQNSLAAQAELQDWFYLPIWGQTPLPAPPPDAGQPLLVFADDDGVGAALTVHLEQRHRVIRVERSSAFARLDTGRYAIRPDEPADYHALLAAVHAEVQPLHRIIHAWGLPSPSGARDPIQDFSSLALLAHALAANEQPAGQLVVVTEQLQDVLGTESIDPLRSSVLGLSLVVPQEYHELTCRAIDIVRPVPEMLETLLNLLQREIESDADDAVVAYRGTRRFVPRMAPTPLHDELPQWPLRPQGTYLITEGQSALGILLAEYLAETVQARLILIADPQAQTDVDDKRLIQALQRHGAKVAIYPVALETPGALDAAVADGVAAFGPLHGVIHLARSGIEAGTRRTVAELHHAGVRELLEGTAAQIAAIAEVARRHTPDFCLVLSSIAAVVGGPACALPAAVGRVLDSAVAVQSRATHQRWISVALDPWSAETARDPHLSALFGRWALSPAQGKEVLRRTIMLAPSGSLTVSAADPLARQRQAGRLGDAPDAPQAQAALDLVHPRPQLATPYVAPRNTTEQTIADIWQVVLGVERVGIHDNFFELGGHSLIAAQIISRLRHVFQVDVPHEEVIVSPTIAELAETIAAIVQSQDQEKLAILQMLAELSEEDVDQELSQQQTLVQEHAPRRAGGDDNL